MVSMVVTTSSERPCAVIENISTCCRSEYNAGSFADSSAACATAIARANYPDRASARARS